MKLEQAVYQDHFADMKTASSSYHSLEVQEKKNTLSVYLEHGTVTVCMD